jgi:hypothetical protein
MWPIPQLGIDNPELFLFVIDDVGLQKKSGRTVGHPGKSGGLFDAPVHALLGHLPAGFDVSRS